MMLLKDTVREKINFKKVASHQMPSDTSEWYDEILKSFYEQVNYIPKEFKVTVRVPNLDENKGYAKGSIVVSYSGKSINYPIIIKDYELSPFDVFVFNEGEKEMYRKSSINSLKQVLQSNVLGEPENINKYNNDYSDVKRPGGINPPEPVNLADYNVLRGYADYEKVAELWKLTAKKEDLEKFASYLIDQPDLARMYYTNTGDTITNTLNLVNEDRVVDDDHDHGELDIRDVVKAKKAATAIDSQLFNVEDMKPVKPPSVAELRLYEYPCMEDFMERGDGIADRAIASRTGKPISGIVVDCVDKYEFKSNNVYRKSYNHSDGDNDTKNKRDQIFVALDGSGYCEAYDYSRSGTSFYSAKTLDGANAMQKALKMVYKNTSSDFTNYDPKQRNSGCDLVFLPNERKDQGRGNYHHQHSGFSIGGMGEGRLLVIYGANGIYESIKFEGDFRRVKVNDTYAYFNSDCAIVPANVATCQLVKEVKDQMYQMAIGKPKEIYLVPELAVIINIGCMNRFDLEDFMRPSKSIQKMYAEKGIKTASLQIQGSGYKIISDALKPLEKIARMKCENLNTKTARTCLQTIGLTKEAADEAMKVAINRSITNGGPVTIYGVRDDYISSEKYDGMRKTAKFKGILKQYADELKVNLVKEASMLDDPKSVDVVLGLNFINEDNVNRYIDNIDGLKKLSSDMAELVVASRMGLSDVDEGAASKILDSTETVISGLENLRLAVRD